VMDYAAAYLYSKELTFWPAIDDQLTRDAFEHNVEVRLLISQWKHSSPKMFGYLKSLQSFTSSCRKGKILVKIFTVPSFSVRQSKIPFARVNHNKYMVTDKSAYVGTSNWSGDYFTNTAGVGFVVTPKGNGSSNSSLYTNANSSNKNDGDRVEENNFRSDLAQIFERDWNSSYAILLDEMFARYTFSDLQDLLGTSSSDREDEGGSSVEVAMDDE